MEFEDVNNEIKVMPNGLHRIDLKTIKRMYSEEDLKEAFKSCYTPFSFDRIGDLEQDFNNWFEQFKKK